MAGSLYDILEWAKSNGEVKVIDRIRVMVLPITMKEKIMLTNVTKTTACSNECLDAVRKAATQVVGKACPH
jgi:hypothetical protein